MKSQKTRASAQELALASNAAAKDARFESAFRPLEKQAIDEVTNVDVGTRKKLLSGRASADTAQGAGRSAPVTGGGRSITNGFNRELTVSGAGSIARTEAGKNAQTSIDADRMNVIRTGQDVSVTADNAFVNSARLASSRAQNKLHAKQTVDQATGQALGSIVASGVQGHFAAKDIATQPGTTPAGFTGPPQQYATPKKDLNFYQRNVFRRNG